MAPPAKKTKGRQKIEMKLIRDDNARRITFTKRRGGLFKKATELSALCGAEIAMIVLSSGGKAYSFGHPCVESVVSRFLDVAPEDSLNGFVDDGNDDRLHRLTEQCDIMNQELEIEKRRGKELEEALGSSPSGLVSGEFLSRLNLAQLLQLKEALEKLRDGIRRAVDSSAESLNLAKFESDPIPYNWLKL